MNIITDVIESDNQTGISKYCQYHGGNDIHSIDNLLIDMSVTCNKIGLVDGFFEHITLDRFLYLAGHYPPNATNQDPELCSAYNEFIKSCDLTKLSDSQSIGSTGDVADRAIFGNGASELIDLAIRMIPAGDWKTNFVETQYREYRNSCCRMGRTQRAPDDMSVKLTIVINPNNPTGDFLDWDHMVEYVDTYVPDDSYLIVDESMLFWYGPNWLNHSFIKHTDTIANLKNRKVQVIVIQSWTKFFNCCGLRIGSAIVFDDDIYNKMTEYQVPWSLNSIAREYLLYCFKRPDYMTRTWNAIRTWRKEIITILSSLQINNMKNTWTFYGADFVSWIWIDTHDPILATRLVAASLASGYPIRHGIHGYDMITYIRIAVSDPSKLHEWFNVIRAYIGEKISIQYTPHIPIMPQSVASIVAHTATLGFIDTTQYTNIVIDNIVVDINHIRIHEKYIDDLANALQNYLRQTEFGIAIPSIIVGILPYNDKSSGFASKRTSCDLEYFVIDGHHRLQVMKRLNYNMIPVTIVDYLHPLIFISPPQKWSSDTNQWNLINYTKKCELINIVNENLTMPPKSTQHVVKLNTGYVPISILAKHMIGTYIM